jgi:hypothetical protein
MTDQKDSGLKSSFDLAMERMAAKTGGITRLSDEQKTAIAELTRKTQAKIAEFEIMYRDRIATARKSDDPEKLKAVEAEYQREIERARSREEAEKERIRQTP